MENNKLTCHYCKKDMEKGETAMSVNGVLYHFHSPCISKFLTNRTVNASDPHAMKVDDKEE